MGYLNKPSHIVETCADVVSLSYLSRHNDRSFVNERHRQACAGIYRG